MKANTIYMKLRTFLLAVLLMGSGSAWAAQYNMGSNADLDNLFWRLAGGSIPTTEDVVINVTANISVASNVYHEFGVRTGSTLIKGNGHTISAQTTGYRFLYLPSGSTNVTIENLTISGFDATSAWPYSGGAISQQSGTLNLNNVNFVNNKSAEGGAVFANSTLNMTDVTFTNNTSTGFGGALRTYGGTTTLNGTNIFSGNTAVTGNSIYTQTTAFTNNGYLSADSGSVMLDNAILYTVTDATFTGSAGMDDAIAYANANTSVPLEIQIHPSLGTVYIDQVLTINSRTAPLTINGNGVTLSSASGYNGQLLINNIPNTSALTLKNLNVSGFKGGSEGIVIQNNAGLMHVDGTLNFTNNGTGSPLKALVYLKSGGTLVVELTANWTISGNAFAGPTVSGAVYFEPGATDLTYTPVHYTQALNPGGSPDWFFKSAVDIFLVTTAADSGAGSLRDMITAANAQLGKDICIEFASGVELIQLDSALPVILDRTKSLTIDGKCSVIIKATGVNYRCFENSNTTTDLTLKGITITDFQQEEGAAVYNNAGTKLVLENVNIIRNGNDLKSTGYGGALHAAQGSSVTINKRVLFEENTSQTYGGGMSLMNAAFTIQSGGKAIFLKNYALQGGGGIYTESGSGLSINIINELPDTDNRKPLVLTANSTAQLLPIGVIQETNLGGAADPESVNFVVPMGGGLFYTGAQALTLSHVAFTSNKSLVGGGFAIGHVDNNLANITLNDVIFSGNSVENTRPKAQYGVNYALAYKAQGGGIYTRGQFTMNSNCIVSGNKAGHEGGGVFYFANKEVGQNVTFAGIFKNNEALHGGGIMALAEGAALNSDKSPKLTVVIDPNGQYEHNHALEGNGGFLNLLQMKLTINGTFGLTGDANDQRVAFRNNTADYMGGAIYAFAAQTVNVTNARFFGNKQASDREGNGGGAIAILGENIYTNGQVSVPTTLTIKNCYFEKNEAAKGGALGAYGTEFSGYPVVCDKIVIADTGDDYTRFSENKAIFVTTAQQEDEEGVMQTVDINVGRGGAIYSAGTVEMTTPKSKDISDNSDVHFIYNDGGGFGGAISALGNVDLTNVRLYGNFANAGGALHLNLDATEKVTIMNSRFRNHNAPYGGAILLENQAVVSGVTGFQPAGTLLSESSVYEDGTASLGGAICSNSPKDILLYTNQFLNNAARGKFEEGFGIGGALYVTGGIIQAGKLIDGNSHEGNLFRANRAVGGLGEGAAIYATSIVKLYGNIFDQNVAGRLELEENDVLIPGGVLSLGNTGVLADSQDHIMNNEIVDNTNPGTVDVLANGDWVPVPAPLSHGITFHKEYIDPDSEAPLTVLVEGVPVPVKIGNVLIEKNTIQGNNYGVYVTPYVEQIEITQNTFGRNAKSIHTGQDKFRQQASESLKPSKGNWGIGYPAVLKASNQSVSELVFSNELNVPGIESPTHIARVELYRSSKVTDDPGTATIEYIGSIFPLNDEFESAYVDRSEPVCFRDNITLNLNTDHIFALAIDAMGNTSELGGRGAAVTINIDDVAGSGIDWENAEFVGNWSDNFYFNADDATAFSSYPDESITMKPTTEADQYSKTFFVINTNPYVGDKSEATKWKVALKTADGKRFGDWSFDGIEGDDINMETYRVVQNYNFANSFAANTRVDDFKLLAVVDGTDVNRLRNNKYLSMGNDLSGNAGGGGGLLIKKNPANTGDIDADVTLASASPVVGSATPGTLRAGLLVVDKDADFIVDGGANLYMENADSNAEGANAKVYGPRLIIEKTSESSGIFAVKTGGGFIAGGNSMALYHHQLDPDAWSWLGLPSTGANGLTSGTPINNMLYTASASGDKFDVNAANEPNLVLSYYDQQKRSSTKPVFGSAGAAWLDEVANYKIYGLIASVNDAASPKDLYMEQPVASFTNNPFSATVYYNACTVPGQVEAAQQYLDELCIDPQHDHPVEAHTTAEELADLYHSGWNLISNPYSQSWVPSPAIGGVVALPINNGDGTNTYAYCNLDGTIVLGIDMHNATSEFPGGRWSGFNVPPLTAFFVQSIGDTDGSKALAIPQSFSLKNEISGGTKDIEPNDPHPQGAPQFDLRSTESNPGTIRVTLLKNDQPVSQTVLSFREGATPTIDKGYDAIMMGSTGTDVYLLDAMNFPMAINVINNNYSSFFVPVGLNILTQGEYKLRFSEVSNMRGDLFFKDGDNEFALEEGLTYSFAIAKGTHTNRFAISGLKDVTNIDPVQQKAPTVFTRYNNSIVVTGLLSAADISLVDITGKMVYSAKAVENEFTIPVSTSGVYIVKVTCGNQSYTYKIML